MNEIHSSDLDLNLLRAFYWIYVERSVGAAARQTGVTQSAMSHSLRRLREIFTDELFLRTGTEMLPTARATQIFSPIAEIMNTLQSGVLPAITFDPAAARREFVLAMADMSEVVFLPPLLRHFREHAPFCTLISKRIPNEGMVDALESGVAELVLGSSTETPGHLFKQTLFRHDYRVLAWNEHPRLKGESLDWEDYEREQHLAVATSTDRYLVETTLRPRGIKRRIAVTVGGYLSVPWLLESTHLISTVPTRLAEEIAKVAPMRHFPLPEPPACYALESMWHPRWHHDPGHRWLRMLLFSLMNRYPDVQ